MLRIVLSVLGFLPSRPAVRHRRRHVLLTPITPKPILPHIVQKHKQNIRPIPDFARVCPPHQIRKPQPDEVIPKYEGPLLVFHGDRDTVIPQALGHAMFEAASSARKKWVDVPDRGHNDLSLSHPDVEPALKEFITGLE